MLSNRLLARSTIPALLISDYRFIQLTLSTATAHSSVMYAWYDLWDFEGSPK